MVSVRIPALRLLLCTACALPGAVFAQTADRPDTLSSVRAAASVPAPQPDTLTYYNPSTSGASAHFERMSRRRASYSVDMAGYVGSGNGATVWGFGANPQATIPVGRKADITVGVSVVQSYYSGAGFIPWGSVAGRNNGSTTDAYIYAAGTFYPNTRLTVRAAGFVNLSDSGNPFLPQKGFSVGADYRISRRATIGFNFSYIEGGMPYPYGPYGPYGPFTPGGMGGFYRPTGPYNPFW